MEAEFCSITRMLDLTNQLRIKMNYYILQGYLCALAGIIVYSSPIAWETDLTVAVFSYRRIRIADFMSIMWLTVTPL